MKLRGSRTKYILRRSVEDLIPTEILHRSKMGFPVPFGRWVRGRYRHLLDDLVLGGRAAERGLFDRAALRRLVAEHQAGVDHGERLWSLVNLELWQRRFIDAEVPREAETVAATASA
jgi:asparagine synthase (glutamine-hydrolysing)